MKRIGCVCLLLLMLCMLAGCAEKNPYPPVETVGIPAEKEVSTGSEGDYTYSLYSTYSVIMGYTGKDTTLVLPSTLGGLPVKVIGGNAFEGNTTLTSLTLPKTLIMIARMAFQDCTALKTVIWNDALEFIDAYAFRRSGLSELICPPRLYSIGREAFASTPLTKLEMSETLTEIEEYAFHACTKLETVTFSPRLTVLNNRLFHGCSALTELILPQTVTEIGAYVFGSCSSLTMVVIPTSVTTMKEGIFAGSANVEVLVLADGTAQTWCQRNATRFTALDEEQWEAYYPEND